MAATVHSDARVPAAVPPHAARALLVEGVVQGVGFRPFVWRLASELGLAGRVRNAAGRVEVEAAGSADALDAFARRLRTDAPPRARVERVTVLTLDPALAALLPAVFEIDESVVSAAQDRLFPPDIATCDDCLCRAVRPRATGATATRSSTAPTAARARRSSTSCPTTGRRRRCASSRCARRARASTATPRTAGSTPSRSPARRAARAWRGRPRARRLRRRRRSRLCDRSQRRCAPGGSSRSRASAATTSPAMPPTRRPSGGCAIASAAGRSHSR